MDPPKEEDKEISKKQVKEEEIKGTENQKVDKIYIKSNKKWKDFALDQGIIEALRDQNKSRPTKVQQETLNIILDPDRKKINLLLRAINGSGKTLAFLLPMILALQPGVKTSEDKKIRGGTIQKDEIFKPQGVIIIQNFLLQRQLNQYLINFQAYGEHKGVKKLDFKVGVLNNDGHTFGDIIICISKSFLNRHERGNLKLDNCKYIAIDEIDDIYNFDKESLGKILNIAKKQQTNIIACSATMQKHFLKFYEDIFPDCTKLNLNSEIEKETGEKITLLGVSNYAYAMPKAKNVEELKASIFDFVLKVVFRNLYEKIQGRTPQIFVFFNNIDDIYDFNKLFDSYATDFTKQETKFLEHVSKATIAAKVYRDGMKVDLPHKDKEDIILRFKHSQINVLLCTNIMARGIDIRNATFVINVMVPKRTERDLDIDVDIYLHRVGRTGRHNDTGVALTIGSEEQIKKLIQYVKKIHKIEIEKTDDMVRVTKEAVLCIEKNS